LTSLFILRKTVVKMQCLRVLQLQRAVVRLRHCDTRQWIQRQSAGQFSCHLSVWALYMYAWHWEIQGSRGTHTPVVSMKSGAIDHAKDEFTSCRV